MTYVSYSVMIKEDNLLSPVRFEELGSPRMVNVISEVVFAFIE